MEWRLKNRVGWRSLATELFVVFVGLVGALQVDQWRERRELAETETVYLHRLSEDLAGYTAFLHQVIPLLEQHRRAVAHVNQSLAAGQILHGDAALFELGLIYVAHLPSISRPRPAYDEMVASGTFARLSPGLQRSVSELYATQATVDSNFSWWRNGPIALDAALQPFVEYYSDGDRVASTEWAGGAEGNRVRYDFAQLRDQPVIRNGFYWAEDTHSDWVEWSNRLLQLAEQSSAIVATELNGR